MNSPVLDGNGQPITAPLLATLIQARDMRAGLSTSQSLPDAFRLALSPFAPPQSSVHLTEEELEAARLKADLAYNAFKVSDDRAMRLQMQRPVDAMGFLS